MATANKTWEGVRENGVILITVHECTWARTAYEWEIWRLRAYLQAAMIPVQTRLEILSWLEKQEANVEAEIGASKKRKPVAAEVIAWLSFGVAVVAMAILASVMWRAL